MSEKSTVFSNPSWLWACGSSTMRHVRQVLQENAILTKLPKALLPKGNRKTNCKGRKGNSSLVKDVPSHYWAFGIFMHLWVAIWDRSEITVWKLSRKRKMLFEHRLCKCKRDSDAWRWTQRLAWSCMPVAIMCPYWLHLPHYLSSKHKHALVESPARSLDFLKTKHEQTWSTAISR